MVRIKRIQNASLRNSFSSEFCPSEEAIKGCLSRLNQARTDRKQILSIEYILSHFSLQIPSLFLTPLIFEYALQLKSQIGLPLLLLAGYFLPPLFSHPAVKTRNFAPWTSHPRSSSPTSPTTTNPKPSYLLSPLFFSLPAPQNLLAPHLPPRLFPRPLSLRPSLSLEAVPFSPPFHPSMHENLKRKLSRSLLDLQARREGRVHEPSYRELALRRSIKKNHTRVRSCDLCRVQFSNYLEVPASFLFDSSTCRRRSIADASIPSSTSETCKTCSAASSTSPGKPRGSRRDDSLPTPPFLPFPP